MLIRGNYWSLVKNMQQLFPNFIRHHLLILAYTIVRAVRLGMLSLIGFML